MIADRYYTLLAAFAGSVIACSYLPTYGRVQVFTALFVHISTGYYLATLVVVYFGLAEGAQPGLAFLTALVAKNLLGGLLRLSDLWRRSPAQFLRRGDREP